VVDRRTMERVADRVLDELKLREHQAVIVAHADRAHSHVHILVNRVHPENGRVWDRWQDYPTIQRVLREEERALGIRAVHGTLEQAAPGRPDKEYPRSLKSPEQNEDGPTTGKAAARDGLTADIETYLRVSELAQSRHSAEREVSAARANLETTMLGVERSRRAEVTFDEALRRAYRDPAAAKTAFLEAAAERGAGEAARQMRDEPGRYGALIADSPRRGFLHGLGASSGEVARSAAHEASTLGVEFVSALRGIQAPHARLTPIGRRFSVDPDAEGVRAAAQARLAEARQRSSDIGKEAGSLPSRPQLEARLATGLQRLAPPEFDKLKRTLSGQQFNIALKLRQMVRDAVLGRDTDS
jgi:hypothetical protein